MPTILFPAATALVHGADKKNYKSKVVEMRKKKKEKGIIKNDAAQSDVNNRYTRTTHVASRGRLEGEKIACARVHNEMGGGSFTFCRSCIRDLI